MLMMTDVITPPHSTTSTTLHHTPPHSTTLHHTPPHSTTLHHTPPHSTTLHHTPPHSTTLHHTPPHSTTLHHTPPYSTTLHHKKGCRTASILLLIYEYNNYNKYCTDIVPLSVPCMMIKLTSLTALLV